MSKYPNMILEIVDSVHSVYKDDPELETDCMLYLMNAIKSEDEIGVVYNWFQEHRQCEICGCKMLTQHIREPHTELGMGIYEDLYEDYCPNCDITMKGDCVNGE